MVRSTCHTTSVPPKTPAPDEFHLFADIAIASEIITCNTTSNSEHFTQRELVDKTLQLLKTFERNIQDHPERVKLSISTLNEASSALIQSHCTADLQNWTLQDSTVEHGTCILQSIPSIQVKTSLGAPTLKSTLSQYIHSTLKGLYRTTTNPFYIRSQLQEFLTHHSARNTLNEIENMCSFNEQFQTVYVPHWDNQDQLDPSSDRHNLIIPQGFTPLSTPRNDPVRIPSLLQGQQTTLSEFTTTTQHRDQQRSETHYSDELIIGKITEFGNKILDRIPIPELESLVKNSMIEDITAVVGADRSTLYQADILKTFRHILDNTTNWKDDSYPVSTFLEEEKKKLHYEYSPQIHWPILKMILRHGILQVRALKYKPDVANAYTTTS